MKKITLIFLFTLMLGLSGCLSQTTELTKVTFKGLESKQVLVGSDKLNLLEGVTAVDQNGDPHDVIVIESIDYNKAGTYNVVYRVTINNEKFERKIQVYVKYDPVESAALKAELDEKINIFESSLVSSPFKISEDTYDPSINELPTDWITTYTYDIYDDMMIHTSTTNPKLTSTPIWSKYYLSLPDKMYSFVFIDGYLDRPIPAESVSLKPGITSITSLPGVLVTKTNDLYQVEISYKTIKDYGDDSHLLNQIAFHYDYELKNKAVTVLMTLDFSSHLDIKVKMIQTNTPYIYFIDYTYEPIQNEKPALSSLSQKATKYFEDVKLSLTPNIEHQMTYPNRNDSRIFKIAVSKDTVYRMNFFNTGIDYQYYDKNFNPVTLDFKVVKTFDQTNHYFKSPVDGDLYIALERNQRYVTNHPETLFFFYEVVNKMPQSTTVTLTLDESMSFEVPFADILNGYELIIYPSLDTYYKFSFTEGTRDYYFNGSHLTHANVSGVDYLKTDSSPIIIYIYEPTTLTLLKENPFNK